MGSGRFVLIAVLAACQAGGVEIIVYPPAETGPGVQPVDEVHLYPGIGYPQSVHLQVPGFLQNATRKGNLWGGDTDVPYEIAAAGPTEPARFTFAARGPYDRISFVAVGMTAGQPTSAAAIYDIDIPTDHIVVYQIGLNPASPASETSGDLEQIELWGPHPGDQTCVHLVDHRSDQDDHYPITFITTPYDSDCDGLGTYDKAECDDHYYLEGRSTPSSSNLSCLKDSPLSGGAPPLCVAGGLFCADRQPATRDECSTIRPYCAPQTLCTQCTDDDAQKRFSECAIDPTGGNAATIGRITCQLPTVKDPMSQKIVVCPHQITLQLPRDAISAEVCANPMFHSSDKDDRWKPTLDAGGASYAATFASANYCVVSLDAPTVPTKIDDFPAGGLVAVDVGTERGLVVPLVLTLGSPQPTCLPNPGPAGPVEALCSTTITTTDSLYTCLRGIE